MCHAAGARHGVVRVAWMPAITTVTPTDTGSWQWWYAGGAVLKSLAITLKEIGRRRMRQARTSERGTIGHKPAPRRAGSLEHSQWQAPEGTE